MRLDASPASEIGWSYGSSSCQPATSAMLQDQWRNNKAPLAERYDVIDRGVISESSGSVLWPLLSQIKGSLWVETV